MANRTTGQELVSLSWWILLIMAAAVYLSLKFWLPSFEFEFHAHNALAQALQNIAGFFSGVLVLFAGVSFARSWSRGALLEKQTDLDSIKSLTWQEFEMLVGEAYKRKGYSVQETGGAGPDGGVDLVLSKDGEKTLVQCKQRQSAKIGVPVVRELLGSMTAMGASTGIVACSSEYTQPAKDFARQNNIELLTGHELNKLIAGVKKKPTQPISKSNPAKAVEVFNETTTEHKCPKCEGEMVQRVAKQGKSAGCTFLGCASFPKCRGTRSCIN